MVMTTDSMIIGHGVGSRARFWILLCFASVDPAMWSRLSEKAAFLAFNIETATVSLSANGCDGRKRPAVVGRFGFNEKAGRSATRTRMVIDWYSQYSTVSISLVSLNYPFTVLFYFNHGWLLVSYPSFTSETTHRLMRIVFMGDLDTLSRWTRYTYRLTLILDSWYLSFISS